MSNTKAPSAGPSSALARNTSMNNNPVQGMQGGLPVLQPMPVLQLGLPANSTFTNCTIHINGNPLTPITCENPQINTFISIKDAATPSEGPQVDPSPSPEGAVRLNPASPEAVELPARLVSAAEVLQPSVALKENQGHSAYEEAQRDALVRLIMYVDQLGKSTTLALQNEEKRLRERMKITAGVHPHQLRLPDQYDFIFGYLIEVVMTRKGL
ncbi:hypothetical protein EV426DRAFT_707242 [Tirmania nivea]|nr:hypothetical protein EV426DRAFT_707242 [Tirmania nivea]